MNKIRNKWKLLLSVLTWNRAWGVSVYEIVYEAGWVV